MAERIVQIIPADARWRAVYGGGEDSWQEELSRIVAWALVEEDGGERSVVGLVVEPTGLRTIVPAPEAASPTAGDFLRYGYGPPGAEH